VSHSIEHNECAILCLFAQQFGLLTGNKVVIFAMQNQNRTVDFVDDLFGLEPISEQVRNVFADLVDCDVSDRTLW